MRATLRSSPLRPAGRAKSGDRLLLSKIATLYLTARKPSLHLHPPFKSTRALSRAGASPATPSWATRLARRTVPRQRMRTTLIRSPPCRRHLPRPRSLSARHPRSRGACRLQVSASGRCRSFSADHCTYPRPSTYIAQSARLVSVERWLDCAAGAPYKFSLTQD
jgi:hypothetical protein